LHPLAHCLWVLAVAAIALSTRNPVYLGVVLFAVWLTYRAALKAATSSAWGSIVRLGLWIWAITIPFNAITAHVGRYELFRLPPQLPLVGGPITLEGILFGFLNGLALVLLLAAFAAFNMMVDQAQLLRLLPAAFYHAGMISSIAVTFIPVTASTFAEIKQAQTLRGHRFRGMRDLLPIMAPLLAGALERSIQLSEAMESRGYGSSVQPLSRRAELALQVLALLSLLGLTLGLFLRAYGQTSRLLGQLLAFASTAALLAVIWAQGRRVRRTHYRRWHWTGQSLVLAGCAALSLATTLSAPLWGPDALHYYPYPPGSLRPSLAWPVLLAIIPLFAPAILLRLQAGHDSGEAKTHE